MTAMVFGPLFLVAVTPVKLAVMPIVAGEGVPASTAAALTGAVVAEAGRAPGVEVMSEREVSAILSLEAQKQILSCQAETCWADIGNALNADGLIVGDIAKLGASWLIQLRRVDLHKVAIAAAADRRLKGGSIDDVLDVLPALVAKLVADIAKPATLSAPAPAPVAAAPAAPAAASNPVPSGPPAAVDEPMTLDPERVKSRLALYTDGKGHYVAVVPFAGTDLPLLSGDGKRFYLQRVHGGGHDKDTYFSLSFWDPRVARSTPTFGLQSGKVTLSCGERDVDFAPVAAAEAKKLLDKATFLRPRWRRYAHALARDDDGNYYFVDGTRDAAGKPVHDGDYRLFVGPKGRLAPLGVKGALTDKAGELFLTERGKLRLGRDKEGKPVAEWLDGGRTLPLTALVVEDNTELVYVKLGVYAGQRLGTPCDDQL
ncbi:MAG: hypothetical protein HY903_12645 [Deltaproteobacteria bacterium]|nr:hypothetical protein [Deltaproteobacteria bacterium]